MKLNKLTAIKERSKKRLGRGIGSGKGGHTVGRGHKGAKARSGNGKPNLGFEGGQVPLYKRLPRLRGFRVPGKTPPIIVSISRFNAFKDGQEVTPKMLLEKGIIEYLPKLGVKVLSNGELKKKVVLKGFKISASALKQIEKAEAKVLE